MATFLLEGMGNDFPTLLDFHPSLGHSGHGAATVLPSPRELPPRFLPGHVFRLTADEAT
jgi:hypothetical protein